MNDIRVCVIGLGYVGLPSAVLFSTKFKTVGFDVNGARCQELMSGYDRNLEVNSNELVAAVNRGLSFTSAVEEIRECNFYVVAVPTPVDVHKNPDLSMLLSACSTVGQVIGRNDIVVFESTVYPGITEDVCIPEIEKASGLKFNEDFYAGYSPERINPGDREHPVESIIKITSGSTSEAAEIIDDVYNRILVNGTFRASSIKVAEAAKVIENSQRDINIAFVNELSKIFSLLDIDTKEVLEAAGTKWNFIKMNPGLVGGHCISVDPYYLAQCAQIHGYNPEVILAGRRINDSMAAFVASQVIKLMLKKSIGVLDAEILIMGFTFKENCPDIRNTKIIDLYRSLMEYNVRSITIYDPWTNPEDAWEKYGVKVITELPKQQFDAAVVAVGHRQFRNMEIDFGSVLKPVHVLYDVKGVLTPELIDGRL